MNYFQEYTDEDYKKAAVLSLLDGQLTAAEYISCIFGNRQTRQMILQKTEIPSKKVLQSIRIFDIIQSFLYVHTDGKEPQRWITANGARFPIDEDGISATGPNKFTQGFSQRNLEAHWDGTHGHSRQYPGMTMQEYAKRALELIQKPVRGNVLGYKNAQGQIVRYDRETNDFVKGHPSLGIATMFKPAAGEAYFLRKKEQEGFDGT